MPVTHIDHDALHWQGIICLISFNGFYWTFLLEGLNNLYSYHLRILSNLLNQSVLKSKIES